MRTRETRKRASKTEIAISGGAMTVATGAVRSELGWSRGQGGKKKSK